VDVMREAGEVIVLLEFEKPVFIGSVVVVGTATNVFVEFEEPVLIARVEFAGVEVAAARLEEELLWRKIPPSVLVAVGYMEAAASVGNVDTVVETTDSGALVGSAGREDP
jgi:hypothetical protein